MFRGKRSHANSNFTVLPLKPSLRVMRRRATLKTIPAGICVDFPLL
ncbi:hypothetical protein H206_05650 [Candidatus Electrothrix aarhusensis]|uniref:Uncharacterized protein n=1 Tax=Candidatus Electrothrix aarhusensis TaxID=1859131 RepID=A0A444J3U0_9BACT|nr:hypothetical protein H206_05650 [Candidatus Electrothrix aarhusensis]